MPQSASPAPSVAVIGSGVSGLSAAWLLSRSCKVVIYEQDQRIGGHVHTVETPHTNPVDTGFIVYNAMNYPNLVALFDHLKVPTKPADMSFAVSLDKGAIEYGGVGLAPIFGRLTNLLRPRFWAMLKDLYRFYNQAPGHIEMAEKSLISLGDYLDQQGYCDAFIDEHLLPQAAAIWSTPCADVRAYPAAAFIRFFDNHGLLKLAGRPIWRTVDGGARTYVKALLADFSGEIRQGLGAVSVHRHADGVDVTDSHGQTQRYDQVVIATHGDQALKLLADPTPAESRLLSAFRYVKNHAVLHSDVSLMPKRKVTWSSWNYVGAKGKGPERDLCVTYWMNLLQSVPGKRQQFLTLNPIHPPAEDTILHSQIYEHPLFDAAAIAAQRELWSLQGARRTWFCGAHFGSGFHEDGLQSGLAVAEALGGVRRPWSVENESGRIHLAPDQAEAA
jgi:predicted NAD/FAD-binding protein